MDVSKFRRSTNVRDLRGQPPAAAMTIRGRPPKEVAKKKRGLSAARRPRSY